MRDVALNCQVLILFKSPRDTGQIKVLARQTRIKQLEQAYLDAIKERYGYLIVNLQPAVNELLQLQSGLFDSHRRVYLKR